VSGTLVDASGTGVVPPASSPPPPPLPLLPPPPLLLPLPPQTPIAQRWPNPQIMLHDPQFSESLARSAHAMSQKVRPCGHAHWPLTHDWPPKHTVLHPPQLLLSL
jgi:hypothetical protein